MTGNALVCTIPFTVFWCVLALHGTIKHLIGGNINTEWLDRVYAIIADIIALGLILLWIFAR